MSADIGAIVDFVGDEQLRQQSASISPRTIWMFLGLNGGHQWQLGRRNIFYHIANEIPDSSGKILQLSSYVKCKKVVLLHMYQSMRLKTKKSFSLTYKFYIDTSFTKVGLGGFKVVKSCICETKSLTTAGWQPIARKCCSSTWLTSMLKPESHQWLLNTS